MRLLARNQAYLRNLEMCLNLVEFACFVRRYNDFDDVDAGDIKGRCTNTEALISHFPATV